MNKSANWKIRYVRLKSINSIYNNETKEKEV